MIIAILAAMLLPALNAAKQKAQAISCLSNLKQAGTWWQMYVDVSNGWCTPHYDSAQNNRLWMELYEDAGVFKIKNVWKSLYCPSWISPEALETHKTGGTRGYGITTRYGLTNYKKQSQLLREYGLKTATEKNGVFGTLFVDTVMYKSVPRSQWYYFTVAVSEPTVGSKLIHARHSNHANQVFFQGNARAVSYAEMRASIPAALWTIVNYK